MSAIKEIIHARISDLEAEIAECKRALAAMEPISIKVGDKVFEKGVHTGTIAAVVTGGQKQTLADIIKEMLRAGPLSRNEIATSMQAHRAGTTPQTISGTLNGMGKAGVVKLKNKKWSLKA